MLAPVSIYAVAMHEIDFCAMDRVTNMTMTSKDSTYGQRRNSNEQKSIRKRKKLSVMEELPEKNNNEDQH